MLLQHSAAFSSFSVKNLDQAKTFYGEKLGFEVQQDEMGLTMRLAQGVQVFLYQKDNHEPATFTVLNFVIENIDAMVDSLKAKGIQFEQYDLGNGAKTDDKGVLRGRSVNVGPDIAWFKDPDSNVIAIMQK